MGKNDRYTELTREELYKQVWAEPMTKLASKYGLSDRGVGKICDRMGIPTPGRGYWAKVQNGRTVKQTKLPALKAGQKDRVVLDARGKIEDELEELPAEIAFEQDPANRIEVLEELDDPHPIVKKTAKSLRGAGADDYGMARPRAKGCPDVRIGKESIDRISRILDALIKALEVRGIGLVQGEKDGDGLRLLVDGEPLEFRLEETARRERYQPTAAEKRALAKDPSYSWRFPRDTFSPSGKLSLQLGSRWGSRGMRTTWADGKRQRVEQYLNQFVATAHQLAAREKADRIRREIEARERAERERLREILCQQIIDEQGRVDALMAQAKDWQVAQQLRGYVGAVRRAGYYAQSAITDDRGLEAWCDWALDQASRLDPTVSSPPSVLDYKDQFFWRDGIPC